MKIINVSESSEKNWFWINNHFKDQPHEWLNYTCHGYTALKSLPKSESLGRLTAALQACKKAREAPSILVSHGHSLGLFTGFNAKIFCPETPHLAFTFSFTDLPKGVKRKLAIQSAKQPKKFVCSTTMEREVYSKHFEIPIEKIDMVHWSSEPPVIDPNMQPIEKGRYFCALGGQGRNYRVLIEAMKLLPDMKCVIVGTPASLEGLTIPDNVKVYTNIPLKDAHNILHFSEFMVLPLRVAETPTGHMTIVSSMFFKKAILVSDLNYVYDYVDDSKTGLFFEHDNPQDLKQKIAALWENTENTVAMNDSAFAFAQEHCTEQGAVNYFKKFLLEYGSA